MQEKILVTFLSYFLFMTYAYPEISNPRLAWASMVVPSVMMLVAFVGCLFWRKPEGSASVIVGQYFRYDWQCLLVGFALLSPVASSLNGHPLDAAASAILALLIVVITGGDAAVRVPQLLSLALAACLGGSVVSYHLGINPFGYLPWHEAVNPTFEGISRPSLFPGLSDSVLFSITALVAALWFRPCLWFVTAGAAAYFLYFSSSRTAIAMVAAVSLSEILSRIRVRGTLNFLVVALALVFAVGFADRAIPPLVKIERSLRGGESFIATRFIRQVARWDEEYARKVLSGEIWVDEEYKRLFEKDLLDNNPHLSGRASLWRDHLKAFASSPLTGVGRERAMASIERTSLSSSISGSESFFTRILAEFGIVALLFWAAVWRLFVHFDRQENAIGRGLTVGLVVTLCLYGSSAVPYSFVFLCYVALIAHAMAIWEQKSVSTAAANSESVSAA